MLHLTWGRKACEDQWVTPSFFVSLQSGKRPEFNP
jgi:hypothetical protein